MGQNQFGVKIKSFRTDNVRDYFNQILLPYFQSQGILYDSSCVNTPQQNEVAERKNGHLLNTTQALLSQGNVPKSYWGEGVHTTTYMINRIPSRMLDNKSPAKILKSFHPHFRTSNGLTPRVFGCTAFVLVHSSTWNINVDQLERTLNKIRTLRYSIIQGRTRTLYLVQV